MLYELAEIPADDVLRIRFFLCTHPYNLEELIRSIHILAYHYRRDDIRQKFGVTFCRDYRGIITWNPNKMLPHFGWSKIELINDQLVIIPYDGHFVTVIDCSGNTGSVKTYPK